MDIEDPNCAKFNTEIPSDARMKARMLTVEANWTAAKDETTPAIAACGDVDVLVGNGGGPAVVVVVVALVGGAVVVVPLLLELPPLALLTSAGGIIVTTGAANIDNPLPIFVKLLIDNALPNHTFFITDSVDLSHSLVE
jgi:hypothetical protein